MLYIKGIKISKLTRKRLEKILSLARKIFGYTGEVGLIVLPDNLAVELNKVYRNKTYTPDVLTFRYGNSYCLGEIVVSRSYVTKNSTIDYKNLEKLFIHGLVHLSGLDHERSDSKTKRFFYYQKKILESIKYKNIS